MKLQNRKLNFNSLVVIFILVQGLMLSCANDDSTLINNDVKKNDSDEMKISKVSYFKDFDLFTLKAGLPCKNDMDFPRVGVIYDTQGRVMSIQDHLGNETPPSKPITFTYHEGNVVATVQSEERVRGAYVNILFTDSCLVFLYSFKSDDNNVEKKPFYLYKVRIVKKNLSEEVYYFKPNTLLTMSETDFETGYLLKCERKDLITLTLKGKELSVKQTSTFTNTTNTCFVCPYGFSLYWWVFYQDFLFENAQCK